MTIQNKELLNGKTYDVKSLTKGSKLLFEYYESEIKRLQAFNKELIASLDHAKELLSKARKQETK